MEFRELVVSGSELQNAAKDAVIAEEMLKVNYIKTWKVMTKWPITILIGKDLFCFNLPASYVSTKTTVYYLRSWTGELLLCRNRDC